MIDNETEAFDSAEKVGKLFMDMADTVAMSFEKIAASGIDPNHARDLARDTVLKQMPDLGPVRARAIVQVAIHRYNLKHGGMTYTDAELYAICGKLATG
jgi:hypothetical protein